MKKYHDERHKEVKLNMLFFLLVEIIPITLYIFSRIIMQISKTLTDKTEQEGNTLNQILSQFNVIIWKVYALLQAFGFLYLKDIKDPLQTISNLKLVLIMS